MIKNFVSGGAGFIGSHIVDELLKRGEEVIVFDNLSTGKEFFIEHHLGNPKFKFIKGDLLNISLLKRSTMGVDRIFHFAAHADVKSGLVDHRIDHNQNLVATKNILDVMVKNSIKTIIFPSTSSVYGDSKKHPTKENYPFEPTSLYGATKAACESYIHAYTSYYGFNSYIFRFVSFLGERYTHGIVFDLLKKLKSNPKELELFSDGTPKKSSVYVEDGVEAIFKILDKNLGGVNIFNIGHDEVITVDDIADSILNSLKVKIPKRYLGGKRGWKGDNLFVYLDNSVLKKYGWYPKTSIKTAIKKTVTYLQSHPELFK